MTEVWSQLLQENLAADDVTKNYVAAIEDIAEAKKAGRPVRPETINALKRTAEYLDPRLDPLRFT